MFTLTDNDNVKWRFGFRDYDQLTPGFGAFDRALTDVARISGTPNGTVLRHDNGTFWFRDYYRNDLRRVFKV